MKTIHLLCTHSLFSVTALLSYPSAVLKIFRTDGRTRRQISFLLKELFFFSQVFTAGSNLQKLQRSLSVLRFTCQTIHDLLLTSTSTSSFSRFSLECGGGVRYFGNRNERLRMVCRIPVRRKGEDEEACGGMELSWNNPRSYGTSFRSDVTHPALPSKSTAISNSQLAPPPFSLPLSN